MDIDRNGAIIVIVVVLGVLIAFGARELDCKRQIAHARADVFLFKHKPEVVLLQLRSLIFKIHKRAVADKVIDVGGILLVSYKLIIAVDRGNGKTVVVVRRAVFIRKLTRTARRAVRRIIVERGNFDIRVFINRFAVKAPARRAVRNIEHQIFVRVDIIARVRFDRAFAHVVTDIVFEVQNTSDGVRFNTDKVFNKSEVAHRHVHVFSRVARNFDNRRVSIRAAVFVIRGSGIYRTRVCTRKRVIGAARRASFYRFRTATVGNKNVLAADGVVCDIRNVIARTVNRGFVAVIRGNVSGINVIQRVLDNVISVVRRIFVFCTDTSAHYGVIHGRFQSADNSRVTVSVRRERGILARGVAADRGLIAHRQSNAQAVVKAARRLQMQRPIGSNPPTVFVEPVRNLINRLAVKLVQKRVAIYPFSVQHKQEPDIELTFGQCRNVIISRFRLLRGEHRDRGGRG